VMGIMHDHGKCYTQAGPDKCKQLDTHLKESCGSSISCTGLSGNSLRQIQRVLHHHSSTHPQHCGQVDG